MVVQTDWHAAYQSWKVRPRDSRPYAVPGLPRPSGLLQFRPLQSQHDHECRPSARSYPHQVIRRWLCVYAVRPSRCGRGAELGHPCRAAFVLIIRAPACPSRLTSRRLLTGLLKPFGVRFTRPNTCRDRGAARARLQRPCGQDARVKCAGFTRNAASTATPPRIARIAHQRGDWASRKAAPNFKTSPE